MSEIKKPSSKGLEEVKKDLNKLRKKEPTEDLKQIISEIGEEPEEIRDNKLDCDN